jgi:heat shock protein HslJ
MKPSGKVGRGRGAGEETVMQLRRIHRCLAIAPLGSAIFLCAAPNAFAQQFPFGRDLVLDVNPMPFTKRTPVLNVAENGAARIDLWCNRGTAAVFVAANTITIGAGPMTLRECRLGHADDDLLRALTGVTNWRIEDSVLVLAGRETLRFRIKTN